MRSSEGSSATSNGTRILGAGPVMVERLSCENTSFGSDRFRALRRNEPHERLCRELDEVGGIPQALKFPSKSIAEARLPVDSELILILKGDGVVESRIESLRQPLRIAL